MFRYSITPVALLFLTAAIAVAQDDDTALPAGANATCPVMAGEPVKATIFVEHDGRRVYFCCTKCRAKFEQNPENYRASLVGLAAADEAPPPPPAAREKPAPSAANWMTDEPLARLAGRLHVVSVHFPIALLIVAALVELFAALAGRGRTSATARALLTLGAMAALIAAGLGWINAENESYTGGMAETLWLHRWLGVAAAALGVVTLGLAAGVRRLEARPGAVAAPAGWLAGYRAALLVVAGLVGMAGHFGGTMVFGEDDYSGVFRSGPAQDAQTDQPGDDPPRSEAQGPTRGDAAAAEPTSAALESALFSTDNEKLFTLRRRVRLAELPPASAVPETRVPADNEIDRFIGVAWEQAGLAEATNPPPICDDATFVRRVYLDLIGVTPTIDEADAFLRDTRADKRRRLVDELLARDGDYADHWTPFWEDALGSTNVNNQGGVPGRGNYREWIHASYKANKPYDLFAAELIDPTLPGRRPPEFANANGKVTRTQFVMNETHTATLQTAAAVGQVFLATGMKCASCHSHFENDEWPQTRFLGFAGLFSDHDLELIRCESKTGQSVPAAFAFAVPGAPTDVPAGEEARLRRVAQLLTDPMNPRFAKAIVNRLWKRYVGLGLFEPVDDFRVNRPASHPELLEWLADDLMRHEYNLKRTIRLILSSRTYQLQYDPSIEDHFDITRPDAPRYFRSPALRRLTAEQVVDSIRTATAQRLEPAARLYRDTTSTALTRALGRPASRNEISTGRSDDAAVVQGLELLNGDEYRALTSGGRLLAEALAQPTPHDAALLLYRAILVRTPNERELQLMSGFLTDAWSQPPSNAMPEERVWVYDRLPAGATPTESWQWVDAPEERLPGGAKAHTQSGMTAPRAQHYFLGASDALVVGPADTLFVLAFIDPADPPQAIMLQWNDGSGVDGGWAHRAYWGEDVIPFGQSGTASRRRLGPLPDAGKWVRLEIPTSEVGLGTVNTRLVGMSFDQAGGTVYWGRSGVVRVPTPPPAEAVADAIWALFTSPEFQYIR
jgi:uncharacterized membrane protein/YHS domain-containing protein